MSGFKKALREQIYTKILLAGSSGSGKTYSSLRLAKGVAEACGSRIAAIDTENGRIRYYADEFDFDDLQLEAPFTPEKYIEAIDKAIDGGYKVLIVDSMTHEWDYCLEIHSKMPGNSYTNWSKVTPRHDAFMEKILQSPLHVIATVRGKDEYVMEDRNGKQVPKKVGLGYKQRDNIEYNYTVTFNLQQDTHVAEVMKDNTHLFEGRYDVLTERDGVAIYKWANSGEAPPAPPKYAAKTTTGTTSEDELKCVKKEIVTLCTTLGGTKNETLMATLKEIEPSGNPNKIQDLNTARQLLEALQNLQ